MYVIIILIYPKVRDILAVAHMELGGFGGGA